jgi:hypothetical protein
MLRNSRPCRCRKRTNDCLRHDVWGCRWTDEDRRKPDKLVGKLGVDGGIIHSTVRCRGEARTAKILLPAPCCRHSRDSTCCRGHRSRRLRSRDDLYPAGLSETPSRPDLLERWHRLPWAEARTDPSDRLARQGLKGHGIPTESLRAVPILWKQVDQMYDLCQFQLLSNRDQS